MKESIAVIGSGYVGLVTGACFAHHGNRVFCMDIDARKVAELKKGTVPFYEPGLNELVSSGIKSGLLSFTVNAARALAESSIVFICVGTPPLSNGKVDMRQYFGVMREIGIYLKKTHSALPLIIINKSTVPIGTARNGDGYLKKNNSEARFAIVSNPEFLREGSAVNDFFSPDRIVLGIDDSERDSQVATRIEKLFEKFLCQKVITNWETAEMIKYASNAFLATKISFINEIAAVCEKVNADSVVVAKGMGYDPRIGPHFLRAGLGYGGSCFPKDVRALGAMSARHNYSFKLLKTVIEINNQQKEIACKKITRALKSAPCGDKVLCVLGLSFKPNTDDMRESASIAVIKKLAGIVSLFRCYDPKAGRAARREFLSEKNVRMCKTVISAARNADALFLATEWKEFVSADWKEIKRVMRGNHIIDGRNALNRKKMEEIGFVYDGFGV